MSWAIEYDDEEEEQCTVGVGKHAGVHELQPIKKFPCANKILMA